MGDNEAGKLYREVVDTTYDVVRGIGEKTFIDLDGIYGRYMSLEHSYREKMSKQLVDDINKSIKIIMTVSDKVNVEHIIIYLKSFLIKAAEDQQSYRDMLSLVIDSKILTKENKFFLYYIFVGYIFLNPKLEDSYTAKLKEKLYGLISNLYYEGLGEELCVIPKEERNKDFVIVLISQLLGLGHGPTKTLLDRCYVLEKILNKKVFIINTAEFMPSFGAVPVFDIGCGSYIDDYSHMDKFQFKDASFSMFQCPNEMPQISIIKEIVDVVKTEKPYYILTIGGNSIVNDICSRMVPTLSLATVFSGRTITKGTFQVIGREKTDSDIRWLEENNLPDEHMIESLFTFVFREQTHTFTREELGFPDDGFVAVLVGARLDDEIDDECERMIIKLAENGIYIAFLGVYNRAAKLCEKSEAFKSHCINLGFRDDVLAVDEHCDLYINPRRIGGGTSVAEALFKGVPAVTFNFGDVGVTAGKDFHVKSYEDMYNTILRYANDKEFYEEMSKKAYDRGQRLIDSEGEFVKVIETMENSSRFF